MFRDKIFNISFLISLCWHLFCIFAFVLVITPKGYSFNRFPATAFLGPILERDAFESDYNLKGGFMLTPYKEDFVYDIEYLKSGYSHSNAQALLEADLSTVDFREPQIQKQGPEFTGFQPPELKNDVTTTGEYFLKGLKIEGPLAGRKIIYRPPIPRISAQTTDGNQRFTIDLNIYVSGDGVVRQVNRLTTTGYPAVDLIAMKNARGILFASNGQDAMQEGRLTLVLGLE
jgi:hypothetical protein